MAAEPTSVTTKNAPIFDFSQTPRARDYEGLYVKIIDDLFTPEECANLIALAESDHQWIQAAVNYGLRSDQQAVDLDYRNSKRILRFDHEAAAMIYQRLLPYIPELVQINPGDKWEGVVGSRGRVQETWDLVGVNERLSFLRYEKGEYFRPHCDFLQQLPDGRLARATLQIYLGDDGVKGGATRIIGTNHKYIDVEPKKGRVLIFQHRGLYHSGEDVVEGVKYTLGGFTIAQFGPNFDRNLMPNLAIKFLQTFVELKNDEVEKISWRASWRSSWPSNRARDHDLHPTLVQLEAQLCPKLAIKLPSKLGSKLGRSWPIVKPPIEK